MRRRGDVLASNAARNVALRLQGRMQNSMADSVPSRITGRCRLVKHTPPFPEWGGAEGDEGAYRHTDAVALFPSLSLTVAVVRLSVDTVRGLPLRPRTGAHVSVAFHTLTSSLLPSPTFTGHVIAHTRASFATCARGHTLHRRPRRPTSSPVRIFKHHMPRDSRRISGMITRTHRVERTHTHMRLYI